MADDTQPPTDPNVLNAALQYLIGQRQQAAPSPAPVDRSIISLLGEAVGGGSMGLSPADREAAGTRALLNFGANLSAASGPSTIPRSFGQIFAQGVGGAQQSLAGSEAVGASRLAAQQAYEEKQQELRLNAIKEALPFLKMTQGAAIPNTLVSGAGPRTSIAAVDVPAGNYGAGGPGADAKVPAEWLPYYQEASARTGIPVDVLIAQARQESGFNANATGKAGEIGVHQIKPTTAADPGLGVKPLDPALLKDPRANINFAADYLKAHLPPGADPTDPAAIRLALKGYNGGGDPNYVANVTRYLPVPAAPKAADGTSTAAPYKVASTGATAPPTSTAPPAPGSVAAETAGLVMPPGATPPAAPALPTDGKLTFEQFQALHPTTIDPASYTVTPPNLDALLSARDQAKRQLDLANRGIAGDPDKALTAYTAAAKDVTDAQAAATVESAKLRQKMQEDARTHQRALYTDEMKRQQEIEEADKQRGAAVALKTQEGQQAIDLAKVQAGQTYHQKIAEEAASAAQKNTIEPMSAAGLKAHQMNLGLSQMLPLLADLPKGGGILGSVLDAHPDLAPLFSTAGILNDKQADAVRLINGLVANISTEMKPAGLGALREYEWDAFKAQLPNMLSTPAGQQKAVAMLMNMNNRIQQEGSWMNSYFNRKIPDETTLGRTVSAHNLETDNPSETVQQRMDRELGPIIPSYSGPPSGSGQAQWEQSLPPGKPYYKKWALPDPQRPGQPLRDERGNIKTTTTMEVRPWQ